MSYNDVILWFAKNENDNIVTINEVNKQESHTYYCPLCGSELIPRQGDIMTWHFAHVDKSKCSGESMYHFWVKNKLLEKGDEFIIRLDIEKEYVCKDILVEELYKVDDKIYRPDLTILTECGKTIYFEMDYSNKKKVEDYIDIWIGLGNIVVEIDVKTLINSKSNKIPIFNAKYYNGKCFNVKKNNTYYNTIGKYKEKLKQSGSYEKRKKEIEKLDWFWEDVFKYKTGNVDIEYMIDLVDSINNKYDKKVLLMILNKSYCNNLYMDYLNEKSKLILRYLYADIGNLVCEGYEIKISELKKNWYNEYLEKYIIFYNIKENSICEYSIIEYSKENILKNIKQDVDNFYMNEKHEKDLLFAKENENIKQAIDEINTKLKETDVRYNFHERFVCGLITSLHYDCNYKLDIDFSNCNNIIYSNDKESIKTFFMKEINKYLKTVKPFNNKKYIIDTIDEINKKLKTVCSKHKTLRRKKISKRNYKYYYEIDKYNYGIEYRFIAQDFVVVNLYKNNGEYNYNFGSTIGIYQNKLCCSDKYTPIFRNNLNEIDNYTIKTFNTKHDWLELTDLIINIFSKNIKNNLDFICFDCNNEFTLNKSEIKFYVDKGFHLPIRCKSCRQKRKQQKNKGGME